MLNVALYICLSSLASLGCVACQVHVRLERIKEVPPEATNTKLVTADKRMGLPDDLSVLALVKLAKMYGHSPGTELLLNRLDLLREVFFDSRVSLLKSFHACMTIRFYCLSRAVLMQTAY